MLKSTQPKEQGALENKPKEPKHIWFGPVKQDARPTIPPPLQPPLTQPRQTLRGGCRVRFVGSLRGTPKNTHSEMLWERSCLRKTPRATESCQVLGYKAPFCSSHLGLPSGAPKYKESATLRQRSYRQARTYSYRGTTTTTSSTYWKRKRSQGRGSAGYQWINLKHFRSWKAYCITFLHRLQFRPYAKHGR